MELEGQRKELQVQIIQEQIKKPVLTREWILERLCAIRDCDVTSDEGKRCLIDSFVSAVYVYDEHILVTCNFDKDATMITFDDIENSPFGSEFGQQKNISEQKVFGYVTSGDPYGTRTHVTTVKGWCLNRLTNGPSM